jgi:hypothetical protein
MLNGLLCSTGLLNRISFKNFIHKNYGGIMKNIFLSVLLISCTSFAQITITNTDFTNVFAPGNSSTINEFDATTFNIGSAGGGNNWDFSGLQSSTTYNLMCVDPVTTPYANDFPGANLGTYSHSSFQGEDADIWSYLSVNGVFANMGSAVNVVSQPGTLLETKNNPASIEAQLPMTFNTSWSQNYTQTFYLNGSPISSTPVSINVSVDAYGTMTLPGGAMVDALRLRQSTTENSVTSVDYSFIAKNGANISVYATSSNPPSSGVIDVSGYDWNLSFTTDVEQISGLPSDYSLSQNYPNPFNPSTKIEYSIPEQSFVQLNVYDILGNEVATVVNQEQSTGTYRADFNGENLASGLYIAKLQAGDYTKSIKMTLLR